MWLIHSLDMGLPLEISELQEVDPGILMDQSYQEIWISYLLEQKWTKSRGGI